MTAAPIETAGEDVGTQHHVPGVGWKRAAATPLACSIAAGRSWSAWQHEHRQPERLWRLSDGSLAWLIR